MISHQKNKAFINNSSPSREISKKDIINENDLTNFIFENPNANMKKLSFSLKLEFTTSDCKIKEQAEQGFMYLKNLACKYKKNNNIKISKYDDLVENMKNGNILNFDNEQMNKIKSSKDLINKKSCFFNSCLGNENQQAKFCSSLSKNINHSNFQVTENEIQRSQKKFNSNIMKNSIFVNNDVTFCNQQKDNLGFSIELLSCKNRSNPVKNRGKSSQIIVLRKLSNSSIE